MLNNAIFSIDEINKIKLSDNENVKHTVERIIADPSGIKELAFAYYYTGNEKYWLKAHDMTLHKLNNTQWENHEFNSSDLGTADSCLFTATAYSLFGDMFSEQERNLIEKTTYEKGIYPLFRDWILPSEKQHAIDTMGHNW